MRRESELIAWAGLSPTCKDWLAIAIRLEELGQLGKAAEACARGLRSGPEPRLLELGSRCLYRLDLKHEALVYLSDLFKLEHDRAELKEQLVTLSLEAGRPDVTAMMVADCQPLLSSLEKRLEEREDPTLRFGRAFLLYSSSAFRQALGEFRELFENRDWTLWAHSMAGLTHYHLEEYGRAMDCFQWGLQRLAGDQVWDYREIYFNKACVLCVTGRLQETLQTLLTLSAIDPAYPELQEWIREVKQRLREDGGRHDSLVRLRPHPPGLSGRNYRNFRD